MTLAQLIAERRAMTPSSSLEGRPVIITDDARCRGYWLIDGTWVLMNPGDVTQDECC